MNADDNRDVALVAQGDRQAFARLVQRHATSVEAYVRRMTQHPDFAQDVVQEVMLRLWQRAREFDPRRARLTTWLHRIAHHLCVDEFRARQRLTVSPEAALEGDEPFTACDEQAQQQAALHSALSKLPERQRSALVLTYYQELSNREVADILNLNLRALESLLVRARAALRKALEEAS